jgi:hypothetical protein
VLEESLRVVLYKIGVFLQGFSAPPEDRITLCMGFELGNFVSLFDWNVGWRDQVANVLWQSFK